MNAGQIKEKIKLSLWRWLQNPWINPSLFSLAQYIAFPLNPQFLVQSNPGHFSNFSSNRSFSSVFGLSCPSCILVTGASSPISVVSLCSVSIHTMAPACLSTIRLHALHQNHSLTLVCRSWAPDDLGAGSQGQGKKGALLLLIWWGAGEAFVFFSPFLLAADLAFSIRLTCIVTLFHQGKYWHLKD